MSDLLKSIIRTVVPVIVGTIVAQAARAGFDLPAEHVSGVVEAVVISVYYLIARLLERHVPWLGALLGVPAQPAYDGSTSSGN